MKVIIAGGTGMIGQLVLENCLQSDKIKDVISLVRKPTGQSHQKLKEVVIENFEDYSQHDHLFKNAKIGFFCLGVYTGQVTDEWFKKITVDYAVEFARTLEKNSPQATMCLLSGAGADRTEKSKTSFARYKGMAENQIFRLSLNFYTFRPAYIYPVEPRQEPNVGYKIMRMFYPVLKVFGVSIRSVDLASAIFNVGVSGAEKNVLENKDILKYV